MKRFVAFFSENYKPLLVSFFLALLLWIAVTTDKVYTTRVEVPFAIGHLAPGKVLANQVPPRIVLEVSGKGRALFGLYFYKGAIQLDLPEINRSATIYLNEYLKRLTIGRELGVKVVDVISPKKLDLVIDDYMEAKRPVKFNGRIKPMAGYVLQKIDISPDSVLVSGPKKLVTRTRFIRTDSIFRKNVKYPFRSMVYLKSPRKGVIHVEPNAVMVHFKIEQIVERSIYNIPIQFIGIPPDFIATASPPNISIRVKGAESLISNLQSAQITVYFNYPLQYREGEVMYPVQVEAPDGVSLISVSPKQFRLHLKRREDF
ncbi:MAG TPA: hypothetical protein ENJ89_00560 [Caldithrix abyssi]|uniref:YbbR-like domain-containing protein n=1 Tax=Caldithrix abyssi TaxID=187145 RepID=A0A7V5UDW9_CALAY|nr:hypothetical protein [Caldithrix abyssi]